MLYAPVASIRCSNVITKQSPMVRVWPADRSRLYTRYSPIQFELL